MRFGCDFRGWLWAALQRGTAFQCCFNQGVTDGLVPVYSGDLDAPFDKRCLSYIVWQTKLKGKAASQALAAALTGPSIVDDDTGLKRKPEHGALPMDLGSSSRFQGSEIANGRCQISYEKPQQSADAKVADPSASSGTTSTSGPTGQDIGTVEPKRFCLNIRGHDSAVYAVLERFPGVQVLFELIERQMDPRIAEVSEELRLESAPWDVANRKWWWLLYWPMYCDRDEGMKGRWLVGGRWPDTALHLLHCICCFLLVRRR